MSLTEQNYIKCKRYLAFRQPAVLCHMTAQSIRNLFDHEGGAMNESECAAFESDPDFNQYLKAYQDTFIESDPDFSEYLQKYHTAKYHALQSLQ